MTRCPWITDNKPDYLAYHDSEWGVPIVHDERLMFEFLTLEAQQAGLSWYTILRRRENYRTAFENFVPEKIAAFSEDKIEQELMLNVGIIRNRQKINAAVHNARIVAAMHERGESLCGYLWSFTGGRQIVHEIRESKDYPVTIPESDTMSKDMKKRGFKFVGSTTLYAHMQACGMVNDHSVDCFRRNDCLLHS